MNEILDLLQSRRSIRRYEQSIISQEKLETVLQAARSTQSWHNSQCWECVVVTDPSVRQQLQGTVPTKNPAFRAVVDASVLLCICGKTQLSGYFGDKPGSVLGDWLMHDIGLMTQNLCIQAHAQGLGTVVIGWFDHQEARKILQLPEEFELVSLIPLGVPGQRPPVTPRKSLEEFVHVNRFGHMYSAKDIGDEIRTGSVKSQHKVES